MNLLLKKFFDITGALAPVILLLSYVFLVILDLYTTFLASPDLKYEWNPIIIFFNLNWHQILIIVIVGIILLSILFIAAHKIILKKNGEPLKFRSQIIIYVIFFIFFFNFFYSCFVVINNYLSYVFINNFNNKFIKILAIKYHHFAKIIPNYYIWCNLILALFAIYISYKYYKEILQINPLGKTK